MPILTHEIYTYYHLLPVPIRNLTIIPMTPYLGMSTHEYVTTMQSCPKIEDVYICNTPSQPKDNSCLIQLLSSADHSQCQIYHVTITKPIVTLLEENHVLIIPTDALQIPDCQDGIRIVDKPVVLQLPPGCNTTIANQRFVATRNEIPLPMFALPKIEIPQMWNRTINKNNPLYLEEVDLSNIKVLKDLSHKMTTSQSYPGPVELLESTNTWIFIVVITLLLMAILYIFRRPLLRWFKLLCCPTRKARNLTASYVNPKRRSSSGDEEPSSAGGIILVSR